MPYLQIDLPFAYPAEVKRRLAKRLGAIHAEIMQADVRRISALSANSVTATFGGARPTSPTLPPC